MDSNFSPKLKEIIKCSREEALRLNNDFIGTEHLLLGMLRAGDSLALRVLQHSNMDFGNLKKELELAVKVIIFKPFEMNTVSLPLTKMAEKVIRETVLEAKALKSAMVETEHLMLSILKNKEGKAVRIFQLHGMDYKRFINKLIMMQCDLLALEDIETPIGQHNVSEKSVTASEGKSKSIRRYFSHILWRIKNILWMR